VPQTRAELRQTANTSKLPSSSGPSAHGNVFEKKLIKIVTYSSALTGVISCTLILGAPRVETVRTRQFEPSGDDSFT
jgi:hypothetical protein